MEIAEAAVSEPLWFFMATGQRPDTGVVAGHDVGVKNLTSIRVSVASDQLSDAARAANDLEEIEVQRTDAPLLELVFDQESTRRQRDFRPALPLIIRW